MGRKKAGRGIPTVSDVLSGRVRLETVELMRLIHRVNPTSDGLPPAEEAQRYRDKAALQSVLLREHGASLVVEAAGENMATLRHAHFDLDACHAVVSELDEDARSLVRWRLDVGHDAAMVPATPKAPRVPTGEEADLSARGRRALEEYDYDEARSCFEAAFLAAGGGPDATSCARELLELLVDHLADYEAALALPVGSDARDDAIRLLLGRAAVHLGRGEEAERHLRGLSPSLAASALAELAALHLAAGDAPSARRAVDRLGDAVPRHAAHAELERQVQALAQAGRREGERAAEAALASGDEDGAEALCRRTLAEHGASAVARRILVELEERRGLRKAELLRVEALRAQAAGDHEEAHRLLLRARALAPGDDALRTLADDAARRADDVRRADERQKAERALQEGDRRAGLLAWAALTGADRALVPLAAPVRERAEHALSRRPPREAVDAVHALELALASTDPLRAARLVAPHRPALEGLPEFNRIEAAAAYEEERLATARSLAALDAAEAAIDRLEASPDEPPRPEQLQRIEAHLREAGRALPPDRQARLDVARGRQGRLARVLVLEQQAQALAAQGREVEARDALDEALRLLPAPGRAARRRALADGIRAAFCLRWTAPDDVDLIEFEGFGAGPDDGDALTEDLRHTLLVTVRGRWLFVRMVAVEGGAVTHALSLRLPSEHTLPTVWIRGRTLMVADRTTVVDVDLDSREITRHVDVTAVVGGKFRFDDALLTDSRRLVLTPWVGPVPSPALFVDLSRRRVERTVSGFDVASLLTTAAGTRVAMMSFTHEILILDPRGRPAPGKIDCPCDVSGTLPSPRGDGLLLVESEDELGVTLYEIDDSGAPRGALPIQNATHCFCAATAREDALAALLVSTEDGTDLVVVEATGPSPTLVWRAEVPEGTGLLSPPSRRRILLAASGPAGPVFHEIGRRPLRDLPAPVERFELPMLRPDLLSCAGPVGERGASIEERTKGPARPSPAALTTEVDALLEEGRVSEALDRVTAGTRGGDLDLARSLRDRITERHPEHPEVALLAAQTAALEWRGGEAPALLTADVDEAHADVRRHLQHVRGLARFQAGDWNGARGDWTRAREYPGTCPVEELVQALGTAGGEQGAEPDTPNRLLHLGDILGILSTADRLHDAGDLEGARAALHRPAIWRLQEQQSQARLAAYHLDLHAATGRHGFATAVACARVLEERTALRRPAAVPMERAWDAATLQRVRERAEAWLTAPEE